MNSEDLRTFVTLAQLGSYTKTAQKMIVVPSTISKKIKQLELELGRNLIIRDKKNVKLTKAGEVFLSYAQRMIDMEMACLSELEAVVDTDVNIRIGAVQSLFQIYVTDWLNSFMLEYPQIHWCIVMDHSQMILNRLYDCEIDLCFTYRGFHENNCECIPFVCDEMILVTASENEGFEQGITIDNLRKLPIVKESQLSVAAPELYRAIFENNDNVILSLTLGNFIIPFLKAGHGYGFVVKRFVEKELAVGELKQVKILDQSDIYLQSYVIYKKANTVISDEMVKHLMSYRKN